MEPRWPKEWGKMQFLGGTPRMDLWASPSGNDLRAVWGTCISEWHWIDADHNGRRFIDGDGLENKPSNREVWEAVRYLRTFAPWALVG